MDDRKDLFGLPPVTIGLLLLFLVSMDSLATIMLLRSGNGVEFNPVMRWLLGLGEGPFLIVRLVLASLCAAWIVRRAHHPYARIAVVVGFAIYLPVVLLHIWSQTIVRGVG